MGLDGGQSVMALLGGMQGGMMLPQVAGAQFGLQAQQPGVPTGARRVLPWGRRVERGGWSGTL
jgi:hypothetical protein